MAFSIDSNLLVLLYLIVEACIVAAVAFCLTRFKFFKDVLEHRLNLNNQLALIIIFGALSICATYAAIPVSGALANIRDLSPMIAGLIGGPVVGLGAGLIGGIHRFTVGGFTQYPCSISTVLAGLIGGAIYLLGKRRIAGITVAVAFAALMEVLHMSLIIAIAQPYDRAVGLVSQIAIPMILANALGMAIFFIFVWSWMKKSGITGREKKETVPKVVH